MMRPDGTDIAEPSEAPRKSLAGSATEYPHDERTAMLSPNTHDNKELVHRWIAFANSGFVGSFAPFVATDYVGHLGAVTMDVSELERLERHFLAAFPDVQHTIDDLIAEGDRVVLRTTARGTHQNEFEGIPRTGRAVEFTGLVVYRVADDKIAESWGEIDFLRLIRELRRP